MYRAKTSARRWEAPETVNRTMIARWESRGGRYWIELYRDAIGYTYSGRECGGSLAALADDAAAIAEIEARILPYAQADANVTPMQRIRREDAQLAADAAALATDLSGVVDQRDRDALAVLPIPSGVEYLLDDPALDAAIRRARETLEAPYVPTAELRRLVAEQSRRGVDRAMREEAATRGLRWIH